MADWYTLEEAQADWADAAQMTDAQLASLLGASKDAVIAYAPAVDEPLTDIPAGYREAQLMQARNVWNSQKASPSAGEFDNGSYGLSSFPLDWQVRQLIRPKRGMPVIG